MSRERLAKMAINKIGVAILLLGKATTFQDSTLKHIFIRSAATVSFPSSSWWQWKKEREKAAQDSCLHGILVMVAEYSFSFFPLISEELTLTIYGESN